MKSPTRRFRDRIADVISPERKHELRDLMELTVDAYRAGPALLSPVTIERNLREVDPQLLDLILRQRGYEVIVGGTAGDVQFTEEDRVRAVYESRRMYHYDVQTCRAIQSWTDFGFGQFVNVIPRDPAAVSVWEEFSTAKRNMPLLKQRKIQQLSRDELTDGEIFFVCYADIRGTTRLRRFYTEEIQRIIYMNDDPDVPLFYVRQEQGEKILYPDFAAGPELLATYELQPGERHVEDRAPSVDFQVGDRVETEPATRAYIIHAAFSELRMANNQVRGWPYFLNTFVWSRAYKQFLENRATVAATVAMFVDEITHTGGSRANTDIINRFNTALSATQFSDSNPPAASGSMLVHNQAVEYNRLPLSTGAGDARMDGMTLLGQVSAGDTLPMHWRGRPDAMQNRATAREQERPWLEAMQRYQTFWVDVFGDLVEVVLTAYQDATGVKFETMEADVQLQSPFQLQSDEAAQVIDALTSAIEKGAIDATAGRNALTEFVSLALTTYGTQDPIATMFPEEDEEPPDEESTPVEAIVSTVFGNYKRGLITADELVEYLVAELVERA